MKKLEETFDSELKKSNYVTSIDRMQAEEVVESVEITKLEKKTAKDNKLNLIMQEKGQVKIEVEF